MLFTYSWRKNIGTDAFSKDFCIKWNEISVGSTILIMLSAPPLGLLVVYVTRSLLKWSSGFNSEYFLFFIKAKEPSWPFCLIIFRGRTEHFPRANNGKWNVNSPAQDFNAGHTTQFSSRITTTLSALYVCLGKQVLIAYSLKYNYSTNNFA